MKPSPRSVSKVILLSCAFLLAAPSRVQSDWPQWRGPERDGSASHRTRGEGWDSKLVKLWEREVGAGYSGPIVAGNHIWIVGRDVDQEVVSCLTLDEGKLLWRSHYEARFVQDPSAGVHGKGPFSTPTLADGRLFTLSITGVLSVWNAETGTLVWKRDYSSEFDADYPYFGAAGSPLVWEGSCYVHFGGHDREKPDPPGQGAMTSLSVYDGHEKWRWTGDAPALAASPIIQLIGGQPQLVFKSERKIVGLDPRSGKELWQIPFKVQMDNTIVTPLVTGNRLVTSDYQMGVRAWRIHQDSNGWSVSELWQNPRISTFVSSPVLVRGQVVFFSDSRRGELIGLDPSSGAILWRGEPRWGEYATLISWGDDVLVFREDGRLVVGRVSDSGFRTLQSYQVGSPPMWGYPAVSGNRIVVRDGSRLVVFQLGDL